jgi:hypothetical protein
MDDIRILGIFLMLDAFYVSHTNVNRISDIVAEDQLPGSRRCKITRETFGLLQLGRGFTEEDLEELLDKLKSITRNPLRKSPFPCVLMVFHLLN